MHACYVYLAFVLFAFSRLTLAIPNTGMYLRDSNSRGTCNVNDLAGRLSAGASISYNISSVPRWSEYGAPRPGAVVNVATEKDVQSTVQYCLRNNIPFLAQSGTHGWQNNFNLYQNGIVINMRALNKTTFNQDRTQATIQGGAVVKEVIDTAYANDARIITGNCNCVGALGAGLGGGYGNLMGLVGFSIDNYLSLNVVLADGSARTITYKDEDLWWALRGSAPNFGIVTSAVIKATPMPREQIKAWTGALFWREDQIEAVVQGIQNLKLKPNMNIYLYYITTGPPTFTPAIMTTIFFYGTEAEGRAAYKSIFDLQPVSEDLSIKPYNDWNTGADGFCTKGGRKPSFGVGHNVMDPKAWRGVWNEYKKFVTENEGAGFSAVLAECYSHDIPDKMPASSFANRDVKVNTVIIPWYYDEKLDGKAKDFGLKARDYLRQADGFEKGKDRTYINFAYGDESNEIVYQDALPRLKQLKKKYDPKNVFRHWFPIQV